MHNLGDMRKPYLADDDSREMKLCSESPFEQFDAWFKEMTQTGDVLEPNAFALATATRSGVPSVRMVLLKHFDSNGFKFFTNFSSKKGRDLEENPVASMLFYWEPLHRQIRIEGAVEKLPDSEGDSYFKNRPKNSQASAFVSQQSSVIESRQQLKHDYHALLAKHADSDIPRPSSWGGYLIRPYQFEFWQGRSNRLHERVIFRKPGDKAAPAQLVNSSDGWIIEHIAP